MTWQIVTPRKHCQPRRSRGRQCFSRGDDLPCHPVKNVIFILLYRMSPFPTQLQFYVIKLLLRTGRHFHWMSPVAMTLLRMPRRPPLVVQFEPYAHIFVHVTFLECHPPFYSPCKNRVTLKNVTRSIDQLDYRKLTWGIIIKIVTRPIDQSDCWKYTWGIIK